MGAYVAVVAASIVLIIMVVVGSLITINKGYGYKHSVDPLPEDEEERNSKKNES
ncbi:YtzI protein [Oceanobacillus luteolus]|uniref:YtzI protein n=1 Tax=Oceanobacillus luteolus TaxID=1274358 RepID=A0ABW4HPW6_9BACI|nr:YtzI protein [Oceanobacillus luteolus]MCM3740487.1 YtzI protein [Oceanobacillus luteolus]